MQEKFLKKEINPNIYYNMVYITVSVCLTIPSILYLIQNKTIYYFTQTFSYMYEKINLPEYYYLNTVIYLVLFCILFWLYFIILKKSNKIFVTNKKLFGFIGLVGILFSLIIPTTSLDVYSYIGNGWVDAHYNENPYYTSVQDVVDENGVDQMLGKVARCWRDEPVVYGPIWSLICKLLTSISFGNITIALFVFKIVTFLVFMGCSVLLYKIHKKKMLTLLFALNPFVLFEFLANVHNDIFLVFFMLLAIYLIKNKKNIALAVASIAIATGIKYLSILFIPFLLIYALRKEELPNKIKKTCFYAIEFIALLGIFYLFYIKDVQVLSGIFVQQNKYGRSIFLAIYYFLNGDEEALNLIKMISLLLFAIFYIIIVAKLFFNKDSKKITFQKLMRTYQTFLIIFLFILITNFNPWYVVWLFPTLMWQKGKCIRLTLYLSLGALSSYAITYASRIDNETVGIPYLIVTIGMVVGLEILRRSYKKLRKSLKGEK